MSGDTVGVIFLQIAYPFDARLRQIIKTSAAVARTDGDVGVAVFQMRIKIVLLGSCERVLFRVIFYADAMSVFNKTTGFVAVFLRPAKIRYIL